MSCFLAFLPCSRIFSYPSQTVFVFLYSLPFPLSTPPSTLQGIDSPLFIPHGHAILNKEATLSRLSLESSLSLLSSICPPYCSFPVYPPPLLFFPKCFHTSPHTSLLSLSSLLHIHTHRPHPSPSPSPHYPHSAPPRALIPYSHHHASTLYPLRHSQTTQVTPLDYYNEKV